MRIVPARNGAQWLLRGWALFRRGPSMWLLLVFGYWLTVALFGQLPYVGAIISTLLLPAFTMSFMIMCAVIEHGGQLRPLLLLGGFRSGLATLVTLGGLYLVSIVLVLLVSALADGGALAEWVLAGREPRAEAIRDGSVSRALVLAAIAGTPVLLAFWFAPPLAAWDRMGAPKSLFYSFFAGWRNWRAFLVYGASLMLVGLAFIVVLAAVATLSGGRAQLLRSLMLVFTLFSLPVLFGSFYASYRDVFPEGKVSFDLGSTPLP